MTDEELGEWRRRIAAAYADPVGYEAWGVDEVARLVGYADELRADLARVTEEFGAFRDDLGDFATVRALRDEAVRLANAEAKAREERDRLAVKLAQYVCVCGNPSGLTYGVPKFSDGPIAAVCGDCLRNRDDDVAAYSIARIRAEAEAAALERAAQAAFRAADEEMEVANQCYQACQIRDGDARMERASAASDVAFAIRALVNGKDG